jgi:hypothetical protein
MCIKIACQIELVQEEETAKKKKITPHMIMDGRVPGRYTKDLKFLREFWGLGNISRPGAIIYLLV